MIWLYLLGAFAFGAFTAYQDIDSFFSSRQIGHQGYKHIPSLLFLSFNGALAAAFLYWALSTDPKSPINRIVLVESAMGKTLVIAFAVPSLLRSKLFEVGGGRQAVGVAAAYDWLRDKVLHSLNSYAADVKDRAASSHARRLKGRKDLPERLKEWVAVEVKPFKPELLPEIEKEFSRYGERLGEEAYPFERYLRDLIRWAMDLAGIPAIERRLRRERK